MNILLNGNIIGTCVVYANETNSHKTFVPVLLTVTGIPAGNHNIQLQGLFGTNGDLNDFYNVTVIEYIS